MISAGTPSSASLTAADSPASPAPMINTGSAACLRSGLVRIRAAFTATRIA